MWNIGSNVEKDPERRIHLQSKHMLGWYFDDDDRFPYSNVWLMHENHILLE